MVKAMRNDLAPLLAAIVESSDDAIISKSLDGIWNFRLSSSLDPEQGFREAW